jgi:hypothetical protein
MNQEIWPKLPYEAWSETRETLHRWFQIVGKIRLSKSRWINHAWHSTLYVTSRGLTSSVIHDIDLSFSIDFDFIEHSLIIQCSNGGLTAVPLLEEPVASFHDRCFQALAGLGISAEIHERPNEVFDAIPFPNDRIHHTYQPDQAHRYWRMLLQGDRLMKRFRSDFVGKVSPVHFFWGSNDLAVTRFSGRRAPEHPGGIPNLPDLITKEAYSHEVSSCGFWPGSDQYPYPAFYSYAYPTPATFNEAKSLPKSAFFHDKLREFILPYEEVRLSKNPDHDVLSFFQSTYEAAADLGKWDRAALEESPFLKQLQNQPHHRIGRIGRPGHKAA